MTNRVFFPLGDHPGLGEAITAAGHTLESGDGAHYASDPVAVQAIIDTFVPVDPLAYAKAAKAREVSLHAKALRDKVVSAISMGEMASWPMKAVEAVRFASEGDAGTYPMLTDEATERGIPLAQLVAKVNGNAARFKAVESRIGGADGKHRDVIAALTTIEQVEAYDYSTGWPAV